MMDRFVFEGIIECGTGRGRRNMWTARDGNLTSPARIPVGAINQYPNPLLPDLCRPAVLFRFSVPAFLPP
jgi:hypothetical protein